ncbi:alpha-2 adrenergic receptor [Trichonephila clavipes]|nr:alpha-2 adrenergic receptor [Trichonephila clavipes]
MKIGNNGNRFLGPFDESTPCLMIVLMNCQTKLRINHLTAVKSVAILKSNANLNFSTWKKKKHSLEGCGSEINSALDHDTRCRASAAKHNATVQQPSPRCLKFESDHRDQYHWDSSVKYNVIPFRCPCSPFIVPLAMQTLVVSSRCKRSNGRFSDIPVCCKQHRKIGVDTE